MTKPLLHAPKIAAFADLWYETRAASSHSIPTKEDMPLRALAPFMPNLALIDLDEDGRSKYLLWGTEIATVIGVDLTGAYLDERMDAEAIAQLEAGVVQFEKEHGPDARRAHWSLGRGRTASGREILYEDISLPYIVPETGRIRFMAYVAVLETQGYGETQVTRFSSEEAMWFDALAPRPDWMRLRQTETA
ncbi:MAG: hypothetical protein COA62_00360 [Rhodobiaceae bacterium]|nr:MAG: hypothetical protein COA62_00360 [Rhodobiaceae bacterium]